MQHHFSSQLGRDLSLTDYRLTNINFSCVSGPADRMEYARRFRALLADLGLMYPDAAQLLHVSLRTLHNWAAGTHPVPYAVTKLLRLLRHMELPGKAWAGWHFTRGCLVTPEGRVIHAHESSWWSLMVLRARSTTQLHSKIKALETRSAVTGAGDAPAASEPGFSAGLVSVSTSDTDGSGKSSQDDVIMPTWPIPCDSPQPSTKQPGPSPMPLASALTPSFAWPWTPTCVPRWSQPQPQSWPHQTPASPYPARQNPPQSSPQGQASSPKPNAGNSPPSSAKPARSSQGGAA